MADYDDGQDANRFVDLDTDKEIRKTRHQKRKERIQQLNNALSIKPAFTPLYNYEIIHIHRATSLELMHNLIYLARKTKTFTLDTETDNNTHLPALIQIEFVESRRQHSIILLIETCHLPRQSSVLFWLIRSLLKIIFKSTNTLLSWGNAMKELNPFVPYHIIDSDTVAQLYFIDIQHRFRHWYNKTFVHACGVQYNSNHVACTCSYRPYKSRDERWSLQQAIAYTFNEFLNKRSTVNNWIQGLDDRLHWGYSCRHRRQKLIQYAVNDCLAVTKLSMVILNNWTLKQIQRFNTTTS